MRIFICIIIVARASGIIHNPLKLGIFLSFWEVPHGYVLDSGRHEGFRVEYMCVHKHLMSLFRNSSVSSQFVSRALFYLIFIILRQSEVLEENDNIDGY